METSHLLTVALRLRKLTEQPEDGFAGPMLGIGDPPMTQPIDTRLRQARLGRNGGLRHPRGHEPLDNHLPIHSPRHLINSSMHETNNTSPNLPDATPRRNNALAHSLLPPPLAATRARTNAHPRGPTGLRPVETDGYSPFTVSCILNDTPTDLWDGTLSAMAALLPTLGRG